MVNTPRLATHHSTIPMAAMVNKPTPRSKSPADKLDLWFERLQLLLDHVQDLVSLHRPDGRFVWVSKSVENILGYDTSELIGIDPYELFHPEDKDRIRVGAHNDVLDGNKGRVRYRMQHKDGHYVWLDTRSTPIYNGEPDPIAIQSHSRDVTVEVFEAKAAAVREQILSNAFDKAPIGKALVGLRGHWLKVNKATCEILGYSKEELQAMTFQEVTYPEDLEKDLELVREMIAGKRTKYNMLKRYIHKDGQLIWAQLYVTLVYDADGLPDFFVSQIVDVTSTIQQEQALENERLRLKAVVDTAVDAIVVINKRGLIESANEATESIFGYTQAELIGNNISLLMPEPYRSEHDHHLAKYAETGERRVIGTGRRVVAERKDGTLFPVDLAVSEMTINGETYYTGIVRDLTLNYMRRQELESAEILYRDVMSSVPFAVIVYSGDVTLFTNQAFLDLVGRPDTNTTGMPVEVLLNGIPKGTRESFAQEILHADGTVRHVTAIAANIQYEDEPSARVLFLTPAQPVEDRLDARP